MILRRSYSIRIIESTSRLRTTHSRPRTLESRVSSHESRIDSSRLDSSRVEARRGEASRVELGRRGSSGELHRRIALCYTRVPGRFTQTVPNYRQAVGCRLHRTALRCIVMDRDDLFVGGSTVSGDRDLCPTSRIHLYIYLYQGPIFVLYKRRKVNSTSPSSAPRADLVTVHYYASSFFFSSRANRTHPPSAIFARNETFREIGTVGTNESHALAPANGA